MEYPNFKVCVRCFTFNQSEYITEAMNGFVMQRTDFPYVCCIVDDASTDGEQNTIDNYMADNFDLSENSCHYKRETDYASITYAQHRSNKNCFFAVLFLKENLYSKKQGYKKYQYISEWRDRCNYEAMCEGDDWWISKDKLQRQADFLDAHYDYAMSHTHFTFFYQDRAAFEEDKSIDGKIKSVRMSSEPVAYAILDDNRYRVQPVTVMYRLSSYKEISSSLEYCTRNLQMSDTQTWVLLSRSGSIHYDDKVSSVYRIVKGSACRQKNKKAAASFLISCARMRIRVGRYIKIPFCYQKKFLRQLMVAVKKYLLSSCVRHIFS